MRKDVGLLLLPAMLALAGTALAAPPRSTMQEADSPLAFVDPARVPHWITPRAPSRALGSPSRGRLVDAVQLPASGLGFVTANASAHLSPNPGWRRWGTDKLVALLEHIAVQFRRAHPGAAPLVFGDIAKREGGPFGVGLGVEGHASHQNGRDADVYYPRRDRVALPPRNVRQIDHALAQDLVNRFVRAGVQLAFVGPHTHLRGPRRVVQVLWNHDNHVHIRIPWPYSRGRGGV
jgi:murein endopeptidase